MTRARRQRTPSAWETANTPLDRLDAARDEVAAAAVRAGRHLPTPAATALIDELADTVHAAAITAHDRIRKATR